MGHEERRSLDLRVLDVYETKALPKVVSFEALRSVYDSYFDAKLDFPVGSFRWHHCRQIKVANFLTDQHSFVIAEPP